MPTGHFHMAQARVAQREDDEAEEAAARQRKVDRLVADRALAGKPKPPSVPMAFMSATLLKPTQSFMVRILVLSCRLVTQSLPCRDLPSWCAQSLR